MSSKTSPYNIIQNYSYGFQPLSLLEKRISIGTFTLLAINYPNPLPLISPNLKFSNSSINGTHLYLGSITKQSSYV